MTITVGTSAITFNDSTTMTTAAVAGPPGPTGPSGSTGPTGPTGAAGTNASVVTTYGAVGSYVTAFIRSGACFAIFSAGCTIAGACLYRISNAVTGCSGVSQGGSLNTFNRASYGGTMAGNRYDCVGSTMTSLGLSGTWRAMTTSRQYNCGGYKQMSLFVRAS